MLAVPACAVEPDSDDQADDPQVGVAKQAFTNGYYTYAWNNIIDVDLGIPANGWTCFLSAVYGDLQSPFRRP
jgi:hypothetical protein